MILQGYTLTELQLHILSREKREKKFKKLRKYNKTSSLPEVFAPNFIPNFTSYGYVVDKQ